MASDGKLGGDWEHYDLMVKGFPGNKLYTTQLQITYLPPSLHRPQQGIVTVKGSDYFTQPHEISHKCQKRSPPSKSIKQLTVVWSVRVSSWPSRLKHWVIPKFHSLMTITVSLSLLRCMSLCLKEVPTFSCPVTQTVFDEAANIFIRDSFLQWSS